MTYDFLFGNDLKERILSKLPNCRRMIVISAYITSPAVEWLAKNVSHQEHHIEITFLGRLSPSDLANGSSDLNALQRICECGWKLLSLSNLHAKIYLFDNSSVIIGSGNWTSNGLKLLGSGNEEAAIDITPDLKSLNFINSLLLKSQKIDKAIIEKMAVYLEKAPRDSSPNLTDWPEDIIPHETNLYVSDFPFSVAGYSCQTYHDNPHLIFARIAAATSSEGMRLFLESKSFHWLREQLLSTNSKELYFGELSSRLHNALSDDPAPYRKEIKDLLANLLSYITYFQINDIVVDRPNYSQRVRLQHL